MSSQKRWQSMQKAGIEAFPKYFYKSSPADVKYACLCKVFQRPSTTVNALKITYHYEFKHFMSLPRSQKFTQACSYQQQEKQSLSRLHGFTEMLT